MMSRRIFEVVVAGVGLITMMYGAIALIDSILFTFGLYELSHSSPKYYAVKGVCQVILGYVLMRNHSRLAEIPFPSEEHDADDDGMKE